MAKRNYYTYHDVADKIGCSTNTIYRMAKNGEIITPYHFGKKGKPVRWSKAIFDQWYENYINPQKVA